MELGTSTVCTVVLPELQARLPREIGNASHVSDRSGSAELCCAMDGNSSARISRVMLLRSFPHTIRRSELLPSLRPPTFKIAPAPLGYGTPAARRPMWDWMSRGSPPKAIGYRVAPSPAFGSVIRQGRPLQTSVVTYPLEAPSPLHHHRSRRRE